MIKSVVRKSLAKKGPGSLEIRGNATMAPNPKNKTGTVYGIILALGGKGKICVFRKLGGIGDVLMCTPALRQLKKDFPECNLTFAIDMHSTKNNNYYELVKNADYIDHIVDSRFVNESMYDAVVDLSSVCIKYEHSGLPVLNRSDIFGRACGLPKLDDKKVWYKVESQERIWAQHWIKSATGSSVKLVVLHTASMEGKRCWPAKKYRELVERSLQDSLNIKFVVFDMNNVFADLKVYSNCIDASFTNIRQMAAIIEQADFFIGPDSGPMHIAGALGVKSLVIFGSIPPEARINHYPSHDSIRMDGLPCIGCWYKPCPYDIKCLKDLDSILIYNRIRKYLNV